MSKNSYIESTYKTVLIIGVVMGGLFMVAGVILYFLGLNGNIEWFFETAGVKSRLMNASPGAFFALAGFLIIWRYKPKISTETIVTKQHYPHNEQASLIETKEEKRDYGMFSK